MNKHMSPIVIGSLLGAAAIHFVLAACSSSSSGTTPNAFAQTAGCTQWEHSRAVLADSADTGKTLSTNQYSGSILRSPAGWEPFAVDGTGGVWMRRCAQ